MKTLLNNSTHLLRVQQDKDLYFIHWNVFHWNKSVLGECIEIAEALEVLAEQAGLPHLYSYTTSDKSLKFYDKVKPYDDVHDLSYIKPNLKLIIWNIGEYSGT